MDGFNERVHAYIPAKYYHYLKEYFGERGKRAFLHAVQYYGAQRGRRMAQMESGLIRRKSRGKALKTVLSLPRMV